MSKNKKMKLSALVSFISFGSGISLERQSSGAFLHKEADITMIPHSLQIAKNNNKIIRVRSNVNVVLVLLICWVWKAKLH